MSKIDLKSVLRVIVTLAGSALITLYPLSGARAAIIFDDLPPSPLKGGEVLSRGEAVGKIVEAFNLEKKQRDFIVGCLRHPDDCFFVFATMSDYDGIQFSPLILYPDVYPAYKYYGAINTASILGLVHGYLEEDGSPFRPAEGMTRIQALKVVLGAAEAMKWLEKFELAQAGGGMGGPDYSLPFRDIDPGSDSQWWYPRYVSYALESGIIDPGDNFRPDEAVTAAELEDMIARAINNAGDDGDQPLAQANWIGQR